MLMQTPAERLQRTHLKLNVSIRMLSQQRSIQYAQAQAQCFVLVCVIPLAHTHTRKTLDCVFRARIRNTWGITLFYTVKPYDLAATAMLRLLTSACVRVPFFWNDINKYERSHVLS